MKMRNKGKVHPSPSSSSSAATSAATSTTTTKDVLSVLKLLPAAILALASILSLQDKEVLAYMITRSLKTTINNPFLEEKSKKGSTPNSKNSRNVSHKPPMFDCECFDCYTSYWSKWNSSSNRELIHQAIEAFEEHLSSNNVEVSSSNGKNNKGRNKKRERMGRRVAENIQENGLGIQESSQEVDVLGVGSPEKVELEKGSPGNADVEVVEMVIEAAPALSTVAASGSGSSHKGLARKVLPDVLGLFNSRLWSLWGPNV